MIKYTIAWYAKDYLIDISDWIDDEESAWKEAEKEEYKGFYKKITKWNVNDENPKLCYPIVHVGYITEDNLQKVRDPSL